MVMRVTAPAVLESAAAAQDVTARLLGLGAAVVSIVGYLEHRREAKKRNTPRKMRRIR